METVLAMLATVAIGILSILGMEEEYDVGEDRGAVEVEDGEA